METIEQDPNDEVLREPIRESNGMIWKILTCVFLATTIIAGVIVLTSKKDDPTNCAKVNEKTQTTADGQTSEDADINSEDSLALKNFDVNISKLVGAAGFNFGSILSIKTNADGTYMLGEVKNGEKYGFAYRKLPKGDWESTKLKIGPTDKESNALVECATEISKTELELFSNYKSSTGKDLLCLDDSVPEDTEDAENVGYDPIVITAAEALKKGLYKESEQ